MCSWRFLSLSCSGRWCFEHHLLFLQGLLIFREIYNVYNGKHDNQYRQRINFKEENKMREIWEAIIDDMQDRNDERDYELERKVAHSDDEELLALLDEMGY